MKIYQVNKIELESLQLTGQGNSKLWDNANVLTDFSSPWSVDPFVKIEFRALWNNDKLFFCFKVYDDVVHIVNKDDTIESIGSSDRVELFFRKDEKMSPYYCLEMDTNARLMDFKAMPNKDFDFNWYWPSEGIELFSSKNSTSFVVEGEINIQVLRNLDLLKEDNTIETGIFRAKYKQEKNLNFEPVWISWVNPNTPTPNFHIASSFGILQLIQ